MTTPLIVGIIIFISCALMTYFMRIYSLKHDVMDIPNSRSSHSAPTPRGGGIAIVTSFLAIWVYAGANEIINWQIALTLAIPGGIVAAIGFIDDHHPLPSTYRLLSHFFAAGLTVLLIPQLLTIPLLSLSISSHIVLYPLIIIGLVWLLNLYNFMDGIDGIASVEALTTLLAAAAIIFINPQTNQHASHWPTLLIWMSAAITGFLIWNWQPAKIFMGDVCSGFLGITLGTLALLTTTDTHLNIWSWLILLGVFIVDATWTLLTRIFTNQQWHQPHRSHAYQLMAQKYQSHASVSLGVAAINLGWLAPLAWIASHRAEYGVILLLIAYTPLSMICFSSHAGLPVKNTETQTTK